MRMWKGGIAVIILAAYAHSMRNNKRKTDNHMLHKCCKLNGTTAQPGIWHMQGNNMNQVSIDFNFQILPGNHLSVRIERKFCVWVSGGNQSTPFFSIDKCWKWMTELSSITDECFVRHELTIFEFRDNTFSTPCLLKTRVVLKNSMKIDHMNDSEKLRCTDRISCSLKVWSQSVKSCFHRLNEWNRKLLPFRKKSNNMCSCAGTQCAECQLTDIRIDMLNCTANAYICIGVGRSQQQHRSFSLCMCLLPFHSAAQVWWLWMWSCGKTMRAKK